MLRGQLVDAATELLATLDSPQSLTLRMVARQVGVAPASVYGHFADLDELVLHILRLRYEELSAQMHEATARAGTPLEYLAGQCAAYAAWGTANPGHYRVVFGGRTPPDSEAHGTGAELLSDLTNALAAASAPPGLGPSAEGEEARRTAGLLLWAGLHGIITLHNDRHNVPWPPLDELLARLIAVHTGQDQDSVAAALRAMRVAA